MYAASALGPRPGLGRGSRSIAAVAAGGLGLGLVALGAETPWLTVFRGLQPIPGFTLDGGYLSGAAVAAVAVLLVAATAGGARLLRLVAIVAALIVVADSLYVAARIAAYVADPGPAAALTQPTAGPGALLMAAGGLLILAAAVVAPLRPGRLEHGIGARLVLAGGLLLAGWVHLVLTPAHLGEATILGVGFLVAAIAQVGLAGLALARPRDWVWYAVVLVNTALIAIYAYAVLVGLPFSADHDHAMGLVVGSGEPIDLPGAVSKIAELATLGIVFMLLGRSEQGAGTHATTPEG